MNKIYVFAIFAITMMVSGTTLLLSGCSNDELEDYEENGVYSLSRPRKGNTFEMAEGSGSFSFGDIANGELLWSKHKSATHTFNAYARIYDETGSYNTLHEIYEFHFDFVGEVVYTLESDSITLKYGAILTWQPDYSHISIEITSVSSTSINYRVRFLNPFYDPSQSQNPAQYLYDNGSITHS